MKKNLQGLELLGFLMSHSLLLRKIQVLGCLFQCAHDPPLTRHVVDMLFRTLAPNTKDFRVGSIEPLANHQKLPI